MEFCRLYASAPDEPLRQKRRRGGRPDGPWETHRWRHVYNVSEKDGHVTSVPPQMKTARSINSSPSVLGIHIVLRRRPPLSLRVSRPEPVRTSARASIEPPSRSS